MSKRARYTGPFPEVVATWPPGAIAPEQQWVVQQNHLLPDDAPAALRDELGHADNPDWSLVEQTAATTKKDGEK